jgi:predicted permease
MTSISGDIRFACRSLLKRPGFTALAVLTLSLGIGVSAVAFSAVNALLLRPFRVPDSDRLGWVTLPEPGNPRGYATTAEFEAIERDTQVFDAIEAESRVPVSLRTPSGAEQSWTLLVSTNYLQTFSARFTLGRSFTEADLRGSEVPVVVSHRFWTERLGAPASLSGATVVVSGRVFPVLGVVADDFQGPGGLFAPEMWIPLARREVLTLDPRQTDGDWLTLFGRLQPGATKPQAESALTALVRHVAGSSTPQGGERTAVFYPMRDGHPDLQEIGPIAWLAFGAVNFVLLIACFNLSSLLLARASERHAEISVRTALGATRRRILQQLLVESLLLSTLAGAASLVVASWSGDLLSTFSIPAPIPQRVHMELNSTLVAFTALVSLLAGVLPTLLPARRATRADLVRSIKHDAGFSGRSRLRSLFVVAQVAGSTAFVIAAALFVRSFVNSTVVDPGFDADHVAVLQVSPEDHGYSPDEGRRIVEALADRLRTLPNVRHVGLADRVPFYIGIPRTVEYATDSRDCRTSDCPRANSYSVGPGYFAAMGLPVRSGREFSATDEHNGAPVVVSEALASQLWPNETAIGRTLRVGDVGRIVQVIGVAANIKYRSFAERHTTVIYEPLRTAALENGVSIVTRSQGDPREALTPIREQLRAVDPELPPSALATMTERMKLPLWPARTAAGFFLICGTLALTLATIGLFGVMYFTVAQRTREFGVRTALGATRRRVMADILRDGLRLTIPGIALGAVLGYIAGRLLARALFGVSPLDPASFGATAAIELGVSLLACAIPAYRATRVDPLVALRQE